MITSGYTNKLLGDCNRSVGAFSRAGGNENECMIGPTGISELYGCSIFQNNVFCLPVSKYITQVWDVGDTGVT